MPTPTDLVTDLPADFEVFGQAVDTDFADLLGGTTGQILSKASATDLDFTWITNDVGDITAVTVTAPITGGGTSGSVGIAISAATTSASGAVQLSDSTSTTSSVLASTPTATKAAYDLAASAYDSAFTNNFYAGKNKIINGDFYVNQRAFTSTTTALTYTFDRWGTNLSDGTVTFSAQTFTPGTAPVAGYEGKNYVRCVTTGQTLTTARANYTQKIESVRTFAGQTVTVSFWAKANTGTPEIGMQLQQVFGTGGSPSAAVNTTSKVTISTSWARYSISLNVPSISGKTVGTVDDSLNLQFWFSGGSSFSSLSGGIGIQNNTFEIWGVQLEAGSTATPFQTASGTIAGELALCQRYYWRSSFTSAYGSIGVGSFGSTTDFTAQIYLPVTLRAVPSLVEFSTLATNDNVTITGVSTCVLNSSSVNVGQVNITIASAAGLQFRPARLIANNNSAAYIAFGAEL